MKPTDETPPLWERQAWESVASFEYFHRYYLSQTGLRSVSEAYRRWEADNKKGGIEGAKNKKGVTARPSNGFSRISTAKNMRGQLVHPDAVGWEVRAKAWDDHLAALDRERWTRRRAEWADNGYPPTYLLT